MEKIFKTKYGSFSSDQMQNYKKKLHSQVHWFLIYYENKYRRLDEYFEEIQYYLNGLDEILCYPLEMVQLMSKIECARLEYNKSDCNYKLYRKSILDAHSLIDTLPDYTEKVGDSNAKSI